MTADSGGDGQVQPNAFERGADVYARARPSYPRQAVEWLIPRTIARVVDLGAGTGKFSALVAALGHDLVSIEPSANMRLEHRRAIPDGDVREGTFENIPLDDDSTDVVVAAQAWHWADPVPASLEVARILRPAGWLSLVWNVRDERTSWVHELNKLLGPSDTIEPGSSPRLGRPFDAIEYAEYSWVHRLSPSDLLQLVASRSQVIDLDPSSRRQLLAAVQRLAESHPRTRDRITLDLLVPNPLLQGTPDSGPRCLARHQETLSLYTPRPSQRRAPASRPKRQPALRSAPSSVRQRLAGDAPDVPICSAVRLAR